MKIEIKDRFTGEVLFSHDCEKNSIKITLEAATKVNADLRNADLRNADLWNANLWNANLRNADLRNADLWNADLRNANLRNANLWNANLRNANLWNANLWNADLRNADLRDADLWNAIGNGVHIISAQIAEYKIVFTAEFMWIGCRKHPIKTWWKDSEKDIYQFSDSEKEWRLKNKRWINAFVKANPAKPTKGGE